MTDQDNPRYRYQRNREAMMACKDVADEDKEAIAEYLDAIDPENLTTQFENDDGKTETKSTNTLRTYVYGLKRVAEVSDTPLVELDADGVNELLGALRMGRVDHENVKDDGYSKSYLKPWQAALRGFYRHHTSLDVDADSIVIFTQEKTAVDERDMFTVEEVQEMRKAIDNPRERCLFELLAYTGQRVRAIQTLRIKDIDLERSVMYLNEDVEGLKGASGKRPLLGAKAYVRRWLDYHPTKNPEDYLLTPRATGGGTPGEMLSQDAIRHHLMKIADNAGVDKSAHPQIFRHYFTTVAKRDHGLDDAYIKHLRGDAPGSNVMETTYRHLSDADAIDHAIAKFEGREPERESALTPEICGTCGEILAPNAKACEACGDTFTPDAEATKKQIEEDLWEGKGKAETDEENATVDHIREVLYDTHPEMETDVVEVRLGESDS